jgi:mannose-6-phosphate isomerase-like protein (cupin superfamily)
MRVRVAAFAAVVTLAGSAAASAQPAAIPQVTAEADPGVKLTRLIDRAEVRLSRIELQPGAVRKAHAHDDVVYHLWVPIAGTLEITIGSDAPVPAASGQAFFMKRGTMHGFRNTGTTPAALFEIFVKETATAADVDRADTVRALLAALAPPSLEEALVDGLARRHDESQAGAADAAALLR